MERVSDYALLTTLSLDQIRQVRDHILDKISDARRRWHDLGAQQDPELDAEILKIFKQLDELENNLETVEKHLTCILRRTAKRAA